MGITDMEMNTPAHDPISSRATAETLLHSTPLYADEQRVASTLLVENLIQPRDEDEKNKSSRSRIDFIKNDKKQLESCEEENELFGLNDESSRLQMVFILGRQAIPTIISFFLSLGGTFINLVFAGHFTHESGDASAVLAGVSMANMFANVSCLSVLIGMSGAIETLGSQHNGAKNYREVGLVLQRANLILGVIAIPIMILWWHVTDIFRFLNVQVGDIVLEVLERYLRVRMWTFPIDIVNISYEKYLMSIGVMQPSMWSNAAFNLCLIICNFLFVYGFQWDYECLGWSWVISTYFSAFVQFILSFRYEEVMRTLQPFDRAAFYKWKEFFLLGFPGTVMLCSEWWAYEVLGIFAAMLGSTEVVAQTIIIQTASLAFMVPLGLGIACASLVGNAIGAGQLNLAKKMGKLSIQSIFVIEIFVGFTMLLAGHYFVDMFTNDPKVVKVANHAIPFLSVFTLVDGLQGVSSGVLRGAGKQFLGAIANLIAFYAIGLPMAWVFCFHLGLGVNGLMLGISCGTIFQVVVLLIMILGFEDYLYSRNVRIGEGKIRADGFQKLRTNEEEEEGDEEMGGIVMNELVVITNPSEKERKPDPNDEL